jgi:hypothetical protein
MSDRVAGLDHEQIRRLAYDVVRPADEEFEAAGGGTRHWVRDHFLPHLHAAGWSITPPEKRPSAEERRP